MLNISTLPRKLLDYELELFFQILPGNISAYSEYRKLINKFYLIGTSRFGEGNYILAEKNDQVDLTAPASAIYATGIVKTDKASYDISIHELFENQIEIDFVSSENSVLTHEEKIQSSKCFSTWKPGFTSPITNEKVREVHLLKNEIIIVISSSDKKIWVYEKSRGFNSVIPITTFYNEIMRVKGERNPEIVLNQKLIFENPNDFTDEDIAQGFLLYNKFMKKINIDYSIFTSANKVKKKQSFLDKLFGKTK